MGARRPLGYHARPVDPDIDPSNVQVTAERGEAPFVDLMGGAERWTVPVHEHGFIALVDVMPRLVPEGQTADQAIVQAARVSYGHGTKRVQEDRGLIRYLMRHRHTTPFEMVELKFHCRIPMFVARQWIRHRTASVNEYSGRYSIMPDRFYRPTADEVRAQSAANRQGGDEPVDQQSAEAFLAYLESVESQYAKYESLAERGVSRELARIGLPVSVYTEWYWKCDLHNVFHFLSLRLDRAAQAEIRAYAVAMLALIRPLAPVACEAFVDYRLGAVGLTRLEVEAIRRGDLSPDTDNKRERAEWEAKRRLLGL
jgi:thymidylate synthase (FAD)